MVGVMHIRSASPWDGAGFPALRMDDLRIIRLGAPLPRIKARWDLPPLFAARPFRPRRERCSIPPGDPGFSAVSANCFPGEKEKRVFFGFEAPRCGFGGGLPGGNLRAGTFFPCPPPLGAGRKDLGLCYPSGPPAGGQAFSNKKRRF